MNLTWKVENGGVKNDVNMVLIYEIFKKRKKIKAVFIYTAWKRDFFFLMWLETHFSEVPLLPFRLWELSGEKLDRCMPFSFALDSARCGCSRSRC